MTSGSSGSSGSRDLDEKPRGFLRNFFLSLLAQRAELERAQKLGAI